MAKHQPQEASVVCPQVGRGLNTQGNPPNLTSWGLERHDPPWLVKHFPLTEDITFFYSDDVTF